MKQAALRPVATRTFRNKYLAVVISILAFMSSYGQSDQGKYSPINGYGFKYKRHASDSIQIIPLSTSPHTPYRAGGIRYNSSDSTLEVWTGFNWNKIITGGAGIDTAYMVNDSTLAIETANEDYYINVIGRYWTLQQVLNNGSTLTENETITLADSITFASGKVLIENLQLTNLTTVSDTSLYKPRVQDANGNTFVFNRWPGSGGGSLNDGAEGIRKNGALVELGDVAGQNLTTLTVDRYLRGGNKSIYIEGNKTHNGNPNFIFNDTMTATAGNPRYKSWWRINSLDQSKPAYNFGTGNIEDGTGNINHTYSMGFNLSPANVRINSNFAALGESMEGSYQGLQEWHKLWVSKSDVQYRLESYTIDTASKDIDFYHTVSRLYTKEPSTGNVYLFTQGGSIPTIRLFNQAGTNYVGLSHNSASGGSATLSANSALAEFHLSNFNSWFFPGLSYANNYLKATSVAGFIIGADPASPNLLNVTGGGNAAGTGHIYVKGTDINPSGLYVENQSTGHAMVQLMAKTSSNAVPLINLIDQDNAANVSQICLERSPSPLMGGSVNDLIISNIASGKSILFGTNGGSGRVEGMRLNSSSEVQIGSSTDLGSSKLQVTGTIQMVDGNQASGRVLTSDANGVGTWQAAASTTTLYTGDGTANNRTVTVTGNDLTFTSALTGTDATVAINNSSSGRGANISVSSGVGINSVATTGIGLLGQSTDGVGVWAQSSTTSGLYAQSPASNGAGQFVSNPATSNTTHTILDLLRTNSGGAGAANIAGAIDMSLNNTTGAGSVTKSLRLISKLTTATTGAEVSQFEVWGLNAGTLAQKFTVLGTGQVQENAYGTGTFTVTPATTPVYSSNGTKGERIAPKIYTALLTQSGTSAPTATVLGTNEIGSIVWSRTGVGTYLGTLSGAFTANKTWCDVNWTDESGGTTIIYRLRRTSANTVELFASNDGANGADVFTNLSIEIRVYP